MIATPISWRGVIAAPVTPFSPDGSTLDLEAVEGTVERQLAAGVAGLMPCGTTGENAMLTGIERRELIARVAAVVEGRVPVIAGTGTSATASTVELSRQAVRAGADAIMVIVPYYTLPTQAGIVAHFRAVHDATDCPIVVYNNPFRSIVGLLPATVEAICEVAPRVVAIKDSTSDVDWCQAVARRLGARIAILCGDDALVAATFPVGACALASVCANIVPEAFVRLVRCAAAGDVSGARAMQRSLMPLIELVFSAEPFPAVCKAAMAQLGLIHPSVRLPMLPISAELSLALGEELRRLGVDTSTPGVDHSIAHTGPQGSTLVTP